MIMRKLLCALAAGGLALSPAAANDVIDIVGSSSVYPFAVLVGDRYAETSGAPAPKVDATGSGGGMRLFCRGEGARTPDITNASRRMTKAEQVECRRRGVDDIIEVKIGYDGLIIAQSLQGPEMDLTREDIFLALAKDLPDPFDDSGVPIANPNLTWNDVNPDLPNLPIQVLGPPSSSGMRDAFAQLVLEKGCNAFGSGKSVRRSGRQKSKESCHAIREDGVYINAGENVDLIIKRLASSPLMVGILSFSHLKDNTDQVRGVPIEGVEASFDDIADGTYPVSLPLYFYVKEEHFDITEGLDDFVEYFVSEDVIGEDGFLVEAGLIPLLEDEYEDMVEIVEDRDTMERL